MTQIQPMGMDVLQLVRLKLDGHVHRQGQVAVESLVEILLE